MKDKKMLAIVLIVVAVIAVGFSVSKFARHKAPTDERGQSMLEPLAVQPGQQVPASPDTGTGGTPVLPGSGQ